jgi:hypothetical protein
MGRQLRRRTHLVTAPAAAGQLGTAPGLHPVGRPRQKGLRLVAQVEEGAHLRPFLPAPQSQQRAGFRVGQGAGRAPLEVAQRRPLAAGGQEGLAQPPQARTRPLRPGPAEPRGGEGRLVLRVGDVAPHERGVVAPPTLPHGVGQPRVEEGAEEREGAVLAVLLSHEQQRQVRRQQQARRQPLLGGVFQERRQAVPAGAVAGLVVVLEVGDEAVARHAPRRRPERPAAVAAEAAGEDKRVLQHARQVAGGAEVLVVALPLAGEVGVDGVAKIVVPLGVEAVAAMPRRPDDARQVALLDGGVEGIQVHVQDGQAGVGHGGVSRGREGSGPRSHHPNRSGAGTTLRGRRGLWKEGK